MLALRRAPRRRRRTYLKEWRKNRGLTQEQAAEVTLLDRTTYGRIENGLIPYNQDFLERLAEAYNCEPWDLLHQRPDEPDVPQRVYNRLQAVPKDMQERALAIVDVLLKGTDGA